MAIALILMNNTLEHLGKILELRLVSNIVVVKINYFLAFSSAVEISAAFVKKSESENCSERILEYFDGTKSFRGGCSLSIFSSTCRYLRNVVICLLIMSSTFASKGTTPIYIHHNLFDQSADLMSFCSDH